MIVGLAGYARVGKDTAAANMPGFTRVAFADALKADLEPLLDMVGCSLSRPEDKDKARGLLVAWGATARAFRPLFWIERLMDEIPLVENIVITDVRYANEVRAIQDDLGGVVIRVLRNGRLPANAEEELSFRVMENEFPQMPWVLNDGTPADLGAKVLATVKAK